MELTSHSLFRHVSDAPFSIHTLLSDLQSQYRIYSDGCISGSMAGLDCSSSCSFSPNCSFACSNQTWIYGSLESFNNCVVAPYIASNLSNSNSSTSLDAHYFGVFEDSASSNYSSAIATCLSKTCNASAACSGSDGACHALERPDNTLDLASLEDCFRNLCMDESYSINADIGGIGVNQPVISVLILANHHRYRCHIYFSSASRSEGSSCFPASAPGLTFSFDVLFYLGQGTKQGLLQFKPKCDSGIIALRSCPLSRSFIGFNASSGLQFKLPH